MNITRITALSLIVLGGASACTRADVASHTPVPEMPTVSDATESTDAGAQPDPSSTDAAEPTTTDPIPDPVVESEADPEPDPEPGPDAADPEPGPDAADPDPDPEPDPGPAEPADVPEATPDPDPGPVDPPAAGDLVIEPVGPGPDPGPSPFPTDLAPAGDDEPPVVIGQLVVIPLNPCGLVSPLPDDALGVESMLIDVDDDGDADTVTTYFTALGDSAGWRLRIELAGGTIDDIAIEGVGAGTASVLGGVQVDFDISDPSTHTRELLVQAGANAAGVNTAVFGTDDDGCLFRFGDRSGDPIVLAVHESVGALSGIMCDNIDGTGFLAALEAEHTGGSMYDATSTQLVRSGTDLVPGAVHEYAIDGSTQAGWLAQFGAINCGGIVWP